MKPAILCPTYAAASRTANEAMTSRAMRNLSMTVLANVSGVCRVGKCRAKATQDQVTEYQRRYITMLDKENASEQNGQENDNSFVSAEVEGKFHHNPCVAGRSLANVILP